MSQHYFENWEALLKKAQEPFQAIAELNIKTLQNLACVKPETLASIKTPEDMLQKSVEMALANGQRALDYLQQSFAILENSLLTAAREVREKTGAAGSKK